MRDLLISWIAKQVGFNTIPKTQKEFFDMVASDSKFSEDLQKAESLGILKKGEDGTLNVVNQDKVNEIVQNFLLGLFKK